MNIQTLPTSPKPKRTVGLMPAMIAVALAGFGSLSIGCGVGFALGTAPTTQPVASDVTPSSAAPAVPTASPVATTAAPVQTTKAAAPTPATISDGIWTVGEDIPAGTYRIAEDVNGACYWAIYRSGSNQEDIVQNDIVTGGRPRVTLKKGQDFKTSRCGTWVKVS